MMSLKILPGKCQSNPYTSNSESTLMFVVLSTLMKNVCFNFRSVSGCLDC